MRHSLLRLFVVASALLHGQAPTSDQKPVAFDIASIKPEPANGGWGWGSEPGGKFRATRTSFKELVQAAYGLKEFQVVGGPRWTSEDRWTIVAQVSGVREQLTDQQLEAPLQSLLAERFRLRTHKETRQLAAYGLMIARTGIKMHIASVDSRRLSYGRGFITGPNIPMEQFVTVLSALLERPVLNKTSLKAGYDVRLQWTPELGQGDAHFGGPPGPGEPEFSGGSIFTAIHEQLGLKLEPTKEPLDVLVIDHVEKPTPD